MSEKCYHIDITWVWPKAYKEKYYKIAAKCNKCGRLLASHTTEYPNGAWIEEKPLLG